MKLELKYEFRFIAATKIEVSTAPKNSTKKTQKLNEKCHLFLGL